MYKLKLAKVPQHYCRYMPRAAYRTIVQGACPTEFSDLAGEELICRVNCGGPAFDLL